MYLGWRQMSRLLPGCADRPCVVSDVSINDAKIVVQGEAAIPTHFELAFDFSCKAVSMRVDLVAGEDGRAVR